MEAPDREGSDDSESECDDETTGGALGFQSAWFTAKEPVEESKAAPAKPEELKKVKTKHPKTPVSVVKKQANMDATSKLKQEKDHAKMLKELVLMGFPEEKAKKAMEKSKSNVLNDLIDLIIKDMSNSSFSEPVKVATAGEPKKEYSTYHCEVCTFINENNPGPTCSVCSSPAPAFALKVTQATDASKSMEAKPKVTDDANAEESAATADDDAEIKKR